MSSGRIGHDEISAILGELMHEWRRRASGWIPDMTAFSILNASKSCNPNDGAFLATNLTVNAWGFEILQLLFRSSRNTELPDGTLLDCRNRGQFCTQSLKTGTVPSYYGPGPEMLAVEGLPEAMAGTHSDG